MHGCPDASHTTHDGTASTQQAPRTHANSLCSPVLNPFFIYAPPSAAVFFLSPHQHLWIHTSFGTFFLCVIVVVALAWLCRHQIFCISWQTQPKSNRFYAETTRCMRAVRSHSERYKASVALMKNRNGIRKYFPAIAACFVAAQSSTSSSTHKHSEQKK